MKEITPTEERIVKSLIKYDNKLSIFLAGTIDNSKSFNWQSALIKKLSSNYDLPNVKIYNPRREIWPSDVDNAEMTFQIKWEQEHLDKSDIIIMVFDDNSRSPITLLELGLYATSKKLHVFCTDKFYRFDNIKLTCEKYNIPLIESTSINDIANYIIELLNNYK